MRHRPSRPAALTLAVAALVTLGATTEAEALSLDAKSLEKAFVKAVKRVRPAVVHVRAESSMGAAAGPMDPWERLFGPPRRPERRNQGVGSGVIVSADGLILTNHHVAGQAERITVKLADGRELPAKRVGTDSKTDVCLLRIGGAGHPFATLGDSDELEVGQWALAIGNPFGLDHTVTLGIVSAQGRRGIVGGGGYEDFVQTDAAINPGNSGGPLVNIEGEIIGINTAIFSRSGGYMGVGFAIPANLAKTVMDQLVAHGRVSRSWLGVGIQDMTPELATQLGLGKPGGVVVTQVYADSPAARADFERYDVIVSLDGRDVESAGDLRNRIAHTPAGTEVTIGVLRGKRRKVLTASLAPHPAERAAASDVPEEPDEPEDGGSLGVRLAPLTPEVARRLGLEDASGLLVVGVRPDSPAEEAGLSRFDVVLEANRQKVNSLADFARVRDALKPGENLLLLVRNADGKRLVVLRPR